MYSTLRLPNFFLKRVVSGTFTGTTRDLYKIRPFARANQCVVEPRVVRAYNWVLISMFAGAMRARADALPLRSVTLLRGRPPLGGSPV